MGVALELDGEPLLVTGATLRVHVEVESGAADAARLLEHATAESTISNSVARGFPVGVESAYRVWPRRVRHEGREGCFRTARRAPGEQAASMLPMPRPSAPALA